MSSNWRNTVQYTSWRTDVIKRDKQCVICSTPDNLEVHHKNSASYFIDERMMMENGVCLCEECHTNFHTNFKRSFRTKCTKYDFDNFIQLSKYLINIGARSKHESV